MPIRPENRGRYPANWKQIRAQILERASNKCERCHTPNGQLIARGEGSDADTYMLEDGHVFNDATGEPLGQARGSEYLENRFVKVVLTIAHLDHTPENNDPENLQALCQQCHNRLDAKHRAGTRKRTRREQAQQGAMFPEVRT